MNTQRNLDYDEVQTPKWVAAQDARERNRANRRLYSPEQVQELENLYVKVASIYNARVFYNYRERFRAVKVEKPSRADLCRLEVKALDQWAQEQNIEIVRTKNAIIYRKA